MSVIHADNNFIPINNNSHLKSVTETRSDARSHSVLNLFSCQHVLNHTSIVHFPQIGVCVSELHGSRAERANAPFTLAVWSSTKARPVYCPKYPIKSWEINYHQEGCMQTGRSHKKMWASPVSGQMTKQALPFPVGQLVTNGTDSFDSLSKLPVGTTDKREGVSEEFSEKLWCGGLSRVSLLGWWEGRTLQSVLLLYEKQFAKAVPRGSGMQALTLCLSVAWVAAGNQKHLIRH